MFLILLRSAKTSLKVSERLLCWHLQAGCRIADRQEWRLISDPGSGREYKSPCTLGIQSIPPSPNYLTFADAPRWILDYTRVTSIVVRIALSWNVSHWYCYRKHFFHCNYDVIWFSCSVLTQALLRYSSTGVPLWHLRAYPHLKGMHCMKSRGGAKQQTPHLSGYLPLNYLLALTCFYSRGCESPK